MEEQIKNLHLIISQLIEDKWLPNDDKWTEGYLSGIIDTYLYLTGTELTYFPWEVK